MFSYSFHWNQAFKALPQMLDGALVTLQIALLSMAIGLAVALALTLFRLSGNRVLGGFATTWVEIARNTPALFFKNAGTGRHNMVYRRGDGSIGWVEPS